MYEYSYIVGNNNKADAKSVTFSKDFFILIGLNIYCDQTCRDM